MLGEKCRSLSAAVGGPRLVVDDVVPAMMRDKAIYRGEVDARLPFSGRDRGSHIFRSSGVNVHGGTGMQGEGMGMLSVRSAAVAPGFPPPDAIGGSSPNRDEESLRISLDYKTQL